MNKTFEDSNQDFPGFQHEHKAMPKNLYLQRFPSLPDPMRGIQRNKELFYEDVVEFTRSGRKCWGLIFYRVKTKIMAYYRLG